MRGMPPFQPSGEEYTYRNIIMTPAGLVGYIETTKWIFGRVRPTVGGEPFGAEAGRA